jgi:hypothetical protein
MKIPNFNTYGELHDVDQATFNSSRLFLAVLLIAALPKFILIDREGSVNRPAKTSSPKK